jgi:hypothetical protein
MWIRDVFREPQLADKISSLKSAGEELKQELLRYLTFSEIVECPKCKIPIDLIKRWNMARPQSKSGGKVQLTIGLYKCKSCGKSLRKALKKESLI